MSQRDSLAAREARDAAQAEALRASQHANELQVTNKVGSCFVKKKGKGVGNDLLHHRFRLS